MSPMVVNGSNSSVEEQPVIRNCYEVQVHVRTGHDLIVKDVSGSSDPYVKLKVKNTKTVLKTRKINQNLNPTWDEQFQFTVDDPSSELQFEVFDFDRIGRDEFMGAATVQLLDLEDRKTNELKLLLKDVPADKYMGYILVNITVNPFTVNEEEAQLLSRKTSSKQMLSDKEMRVSSRESGGSLKKGRHAPQFLVNVVVAEGRNLHLQCKTAPNPLVKLKLGPSKFKSKVAFKTYNPQWREQHEFRSYCVPDQQLEVDVVDKRKSDMIGTFAVDISKLTKGVTNQHWYQLNNKNGEILLLITVNAIRSSSIDEQSLQKTSEDFAAVANKYNVKSTFQNVQDVGFLVVKVYKAEGLAAADIGSRKSDPFCVLELVNDRAQTSTVNKTLEPEWNQYFTFAVKDINSVLELTIYDEDRNSDAEFLGKVGIPLLKIRNGEKRCYALKDKHLSKRAKGQILLEMQLTWNPIRAGLRSFAPKESKYMAHVESFKRQKLVRNMNRVQAYVAMFRNGWAYVQSCFNWESPIQSTRAFAIFLLATYYGQPYMIPLLMLAILVWGFMNQKGIVGSTENALWSEEGYVESEEESTANGNEKDVTFAEKLRAIQEKLLEVQNTLDAAASTMERVRNIFTFSQPFLSCVLVAISIVGTILLYFIPVRYLIMAWGINKFTKRLRKRRGFKRSNEVLNYLSRAFSDREMRMYGEFSVTQRFESTSSTVSN